jgi:hypothetical protein
MSASKPGSQKVSWCARFWARSRMRGRVFSQIELRLAGSLQSLRTRQEVHAAGPGAGGSVHMYIIYINARNKLLEMSRTLFRPLFTLLPAV